MLIPYLEGDNNCSASNCICFGLNQPVKEEHLSHSVCHYIHHPLFSKICSGSQIPYGALVGRGTEVCIGDPGLLLAHAMNRYF